MKNVIKVAAKAGTTVWGLHLRVPGEGDVFSDDCYELVECVVKPPYNMSRRLNRDRSIKEFVLCIGRTCDGDVCEVDLCHCFTEKGIALEAADALSEELAGYTEEDLVNGDVPASDFQVTYAPRIYELPFPSKLDLGAKKMVITTNFTIFDAELDSIGYRTSENEKIGEVDLLWWTGQQAVYDTFKMNFDYAQEDAMADMHAFEDACF